MIIVGDIASPSSQHSEILGKFLENEPAFRNQKFIGNLEGLLVEDIDRNVNTPVLYNHVSVLKALQKIDIGGLALANNHTLDLPREFKQTKDLLSAANISFSGAGTSVAEAEEPFTFIENGIEVTVFNFCWDFLLYHQKNPSYDLFVATINEKKLVDAVRSVKQNKPKGEIVIYVHWSFDLETIPFPLYRQFAQILIEEGASLVVGAHSHCVQGGEKHNDGYIVYGLGNFFIPHHVYANKKLSFPSLSDMQLALEYNFITKSAICHWIKFSPADSSLHVVETSPFEDSALLKQYSPYAGMSAVDYIDFYKKNRRKKFLIPVYTDINKVGLNKFYTVFLKARARSLRFLAKHNLRKWQN